MRERRRVVYMRIEIVDRMYIRSEEENIIVKSRNFKASPRKEGDVSDRRDGGGKGWIGEREDFRDKMDLVHRELKRGTYLEGKRQDETIVRAENKKVKIQR